MFTHTHTHTIIIGIQYVRRGSYCVCKIPFLRLIFVYTSINNNNNNRRPTLYRLVYMCIRHHQPRCIMDIWNNCKKMCTARLKTFLQFDIFKSIIINSFVSSLLNDNAVTIKTHVYNSQLNNNNNSPYFLFTLLKQ